MSIFDSIKYNFKKLKNNRTSPHLINKGGGLFEITTRNPLLIGSVFIHKDKRVRIIKKLEKEKRFTFGGEKYVFRYTGVIIE